MYQIAVGSSSHYFEKCKKPGKVSRVHLQNEHHFEHLSWKPFAVDVCQWSDKTFIQKKFASVIKIDLSKLLSKRAIRSTSKQSWKNTPRSEKENAIFRVHCWSRNFLADKKVNSTMSKILYWPTTNNDEMYFQSFLSDQQIFGWKRNQKIVAWKRVINLEDSLENNQAHHQHCHWLRESEN